MTGGSKSPGFFCLRAGVYARLAASLNALGGDAVPSAVFAAKNSVRVQRERWFTMK